MAIKPILHRILVLPHKLEVVDKQVASARAAGIIIAREESEREQAAVDQGTVIEIGATAFRDFGLEKSPIKVGDTVTYARYGGKAIIDPSDDVKYVALNDEDIIAILTTD